MSLKLFLIIFYVLIGTVCSDFPDEDDKGEYGDAFEGDMLLSAEQLAAVLNFERSEHSKSVELWPNATVYHELSINFTDVQNTTILKAMKAVETVSCVKFEEKKSENGYIKFQVSVTSIKPIKKVFVRPFFVMKLILSDYEFLL